MVGLLGRLGRWYWGRVRRVRPTRDGWWCVVAAIGLGVAAVNTGNNLAYLLCAMLLALVTISGVLSDQTLRGVTLDLVVPDELYAGRPALGEVTLANRKARLPSYSISVEAIRGSAAGRIAHAPRLAAGEERRLPWAIPALARGRRRLPSLAVVTRFPFALFTKAGPATGEREVLVYPAVRPVAPAQIRDLGETGETAARRRGRGHDLLNLRPYQSGDDPRLIHWPSTARSGSLTVRELEADTTLDTRLVLRGRGAGGRDRLETALSEAASLAVHLLRSGGGVELAGPGLRVALGRGRGHERWILAALAVFEPGTAASGVGEGPDAGAPRALREISIALDSEP